MSFYTKIPWADATWNPITGCLHNCEYCYARRLAHRFGGASETLYDDYVGEECQWCTEDTGDIHELNEPVYDVDRGINAPYPYYFDPTFHRYRLETLKQWKKPRSIFVGSMADIFGWWVPDEWIKSVITSCEKSAQHQYLFLSKNPVRYDTHVANYLIDDNHKNFWLGATVTTNSQLEKLNYDEHSVMIRFLSIEPIHDEIYLNINRFLSYVEWVIVGAETGNRKDKIIPQKRWICNIIRECKEREIPLFMKESLLPIMGEEQMIREFPPTLSPSKRVNHKNVKTPN